MAKPITWGIRATVDGRTVLVRHGGVLGRGPVATFRTKDAADVTAAEFTSRTGIREVTVFERSHGRQWPEEQQAGAKGTVAQTSDSHTACAHASPACEECSSRFDFRIRRAVRELRKQAVAKDSAAPSSDS